MTLLGTRGTGRSPAGGSRPAPGGLAAQWRRVASTRTAAALPVALVLLSLPLIRPNLLGETGLSAAGCGLLGMAAVLSIVTRTSTRPGAPAAMTDLGMKPTTPLVLCLGLAYLWLVVQAAANDPSRLGGPAVQGMVLTAGSVLAVTIVCAEPGVRLVVGRAFVVLIVALCVSYVVTALVWAVAGVGSGSVASMVVGTATNERQPIFFPFTTTLGSQVLFGVEFPRFTGLGREPGWMAMYCAIAYFMTDMVGLRSRWLKAAVLAGLAGCISTAGFGVFVVAWAYHVFLRDRGTGISVGGFLRQILGVAATAGAVWLAISAPVLGLSAKTTLNATSLDERQLATEAGLRALFTSPLGGIATEKQGGINLIADIAVSGLPFVLLICGALILPVAAYRGRVRFSNAVVVIVFLTFLTSQPAKDSTWAFAVVALAVSLRRPDMEPLVPTTDHRRTTGGRT